MLPPLCIFSWGCISGVKFVTMSSRNPFSGGQRSFIQYRFKPVFSLHQPPINLLQKGAKNTFREVIEFDVTHLKGAGGGGHLMHNGLERKSKLGMGPCHALHSFLIY